MATLPNGANGYQVGDGNLGEISFYNTSAPVALTGASVTITAENLAAGVCTMDSGVHCLTLHSLALKLARHLIALSSTLVITQQMT